MEPTKTKIVGGKITKPSGEVITIDNISLITSTENMDGGYVFTIDSASMELIMKLDGVIKQDPTNFYNTTIECTVEYTDDDKTFIKGRIASIQIANPLRILTVCTTITKAV